MVQHSEHADEDTHTVLEEMMNELDIMEVATVNNTIVRIHMVRCKVNFNYMVQLAHLKLFLNIIDGGADTHVLGVSWLKLFTANKNTPLVDVIGFDNQTGRKNNLPISPHATKTTDMNGREIILVVAHGVGNPSSKHTLLCSYQMREMGIIVDDVHTRHVKGPMGTLGTQSLVFKDGTTVDIK